MIFTKNIHYIAAFVSLLFCSLNVTAQKPSLGSGVDLKAASEKMDKLLSSYNRPDAPGLAVSVVHQGKVVYQKGFGIANLEYGIPISPTTVFHVASVSKQFTVLSVLLLAQEGQLSLDDDIRKYFPEMADFGHVVTLRNLANHTSGLRDNTDLAYLIGTTEEDLLSNEQAVDLILRQKGLNFVPGATFEYCNSGYILLAEIVKRVSGKSFAEFTSERIFKPLKMSHTRFLDDPKMLIPNRAYSYAKNDTMYTKSLLNHSFVGSTGLNTTAEDMVAWLLNFDKMTVGNTALFDAMKEKSRLNNGEIIPYALGQEHKIYKGLKVIFHGGGDAGYRSYLLRIPEHDFSLVVFGNDRSFNPLNVAYDMIDVYLENKQVVSAAPVSNPTIDTSWLKQFRGDYEVMPGLVVTIKTVYDTLFLQVKGDETLLQLPQIDDSTFVYPNLPHSKIVFRATKGKAAESFKWHISDFMYKGERLDLLPFDAATANLVDMVGRYYNAELNTTYDFVIKENMLVATHTKNPDILLQPWQSGIFTSNWSFFGKVEAIRNNQGELKGCYVSGQRTKRILFEKI